MNEYVTRIVGSLIEDLDDPLPVLGLLFGAFVLWASLLDDYVGNGTVVISLLLSFISVTLFIGVVKYRK